MKLYAYLACKRPVVGSDIEGLGDVLRRERVGFSFPSGDAERLAEAIIQLLQNRELAQEMGDKRPEVLAAAKRALTYGETHGMEESMRNEERESALLRSARKG